MLIARKLTAFARVDVAGDFNDALRARVNITLELSFLPPYIKHGINVWTFRPAICHSETIGVTSIKIECSTTYTETDFPQRQFHLFFSLFSRMRRRRIIARVMSRSPFHRLRNTRTHARVSAFADSCRATHGSSWWNITVCLGLAFTEPRPEQKPANARIRLIGSFETERPRRPKSFPSPPTEADDVNLQFKLHFRVSRYNWGPAHRETAHRRTEVMVRSRFMPNRSARDRPNTLHAATHRIASHRDGGCARSKGGAGPIPIHILRPFFDYHTVADNSSGSGRSFANEEELKAQNGVNKKLTR